MPSRFPIRAAGMIVTATLTLSAAQATPLSDYLKQPDPEMSWKEVSRQPLPAGGQVVTLDLLSQTWRGIPWHHHLVVTEPGAAARAAHDSHHSGLLFITGNYDQGVTAQLLALFTEKTGAPAAVLYDVPNQPLFGDLHEDGLIAYTFVKYLETGDTAWPLLFPMVKSAVQAMTALQQFSDKTPGSKLDHFVVAGASKRGWTTWLNGASDPRVIGIVPMVYNNLNIAAQMPHQLESWGQYSEQIGDYVRTGLVGKQTSEAGQKLVRMVDPYTERARLTMPKLLINGTNDRYWTLDAASFYFDQLPGDKHLLYVPNAGHGLNDLARVIAATEGFFNAVAAGHHLPDLTANFDSGPPGARSVTMTARSSVPPVSVVAWVATSPTADFRESKWESHPLILQDGAYRFSAPIPAAGHVALFAEAEYSRDGVSYHLSSPLQIEPPIPHAAGQPESAAAGK